MTWPTVAVDTTNTDAGTDVPATARSDILDAMQKLNQMVAHVSAFAATLLDDGSAATARATLGAAALGINADITSFAGLVTRYPYVSGRYYNRWYDLRLDSQPVTVADQIFYAPFHLDVAMTPQAIAVEVSFAAAGNIRVGLYSDSSGAPGSLLATIGTVSTGSTGIKDLTYTTPIPAGVYWAAVHCDSAGAALRGTAGNSNIGALGLITSISGAFTSTSNFFLEARAYASALPATATPVVAAYGAAPAVFAKK